MTLNKTLWICFRLNSYYTWWWNRPSLTALLLKISHLSREQLLMLSGSDDETLARYLRLISPISLDVISSIINIQRDFRLCSTRYINPVSISSQREPNSVIIYDKYNIYNSFHFNKQVFKYTTVLPWDFLASGGTEWYHENCFWINQVWIFKKVAYFKAIKVSMFCFKNWTSNIHFKFLETFQV